MREEEFDQQKQLQSVNYQQNNSASRQQGNITSNETGILDRLKTIVEYSSGLSLNAVRVNYDAETTHVDGTTVYLATGQEDQLDKQLWIVVKQLGSETGRSGVLKEQATVDESLTGGPPIGGLTEEEAMAKLEAYKNKILEEQGRRAYRATKKALKKQLKAFKKEQQEKNLEWKTEDNTQLFYEYFPEIKPALPLVEIAPISLEEALEGLNETMEKELVEAPIEQVPSPYITLDNGQSIPDEYEPAYIEEFNRLYNNAISNGAEITTAIWDFSSYQEGESIVGNYVAHYIQELEDAPTDYNIPDTFALSGIQPTYDNATEIANCWGNCYSASAARINKGFEDLYNRIPIDYTKNANGRFTSQDYKTASTQSGASNFGYGVGGALANGGEGELFDNDDVWAGKLKPGAALQVWHTSDPESVGTVGGHSQIFIAYIRDEEGAITKLQVFDNSGGIEEWERDWCEDNEIIMGANLIDVVPSNY